MGKISGASRFMHPTDQARKEARKKELKKNKKQRQQVRSDILKKKDPAQIIIDLEKLDELNVVPDGLYKEKRKKLLQTWDRILQLYAKEEPDKYSELKKAQEDYEIKHEQIVKKYESIRAALTVKLDEIPLPPDEKEHDGTLETLISFEARDARVPGCPPGTPPDLTLYISNSVIDSMSLAQYSSVPQVSQITDTITNVSRRQFNIHPKIQYTETNTPEQMVKAPATIEAKPQITRQKTTVFVPEVLRKKKKQ